MEFVDVLQKRDSALVHSKSTSEDVRDVRTLDPAPTL